MKKINILSAIVVCLFPALTACVGPTVIHETARTVGDKKHELDLGYGQTGYIFKWNYGLNKDWDLGVHLEALALGIRTKYAFKNGGDNEWSWAGALGTGTSVGGSHYYIDFIGSYLAGQWEPYSTLRLVQVSVDPIEFADEDTGDIDLVFDGTSYQYGQLMLGTRYWFDANWMVSVEGSFLFPVKDVTFVDVAPFFSIAGGYRF